MELRIRQEDPEAALATLDYCLSTCLSSSRIRRACNSIKIELDKLVLWEKVADASSEIIPKGMRNLELVRWHFNSLKVSFNLMKNFFNLKLRLKKISFSNNEGTQIIGKSSVVIEELYSRGLYSY